MIDKMLGIKDLDYYMINSVEAPNKISGVYFLYKDGQIVYIGQSTDIYSRVISHKDKKFDRLAFIECDRSDMSLIESILIHRVQPPLNCNHIHHGEKCAPYRISRVKKEIKKRFNYATE